MVRLSFAVLALSVSSVFARPTHHRRNKVCHTAVASAIASASSASAASGTPTASPSVNNLIAISVTSEESTPTKTVSRTSSSESIPAAETTKATEGAPSGGSGRVAALAPISPISNVVSFSDSYPNAKALSALPVENQAGTSNFAIGKWQGRSGTKTLMNKGSTSPGQGIPGGMSFYSPEASLESGDHYLFSYSVYFDDDFEFNMGGKLPGLYGGEDASIARKCSGGKHDARCWSMRFMWRTDGAGELYAYIPPPTSSDSSYNKNNQKCGKATNGPCGGDYGYSMGRGTWTFPRNQWTTIAQRIKLNTPGQADGEAEVYVNGVSKLLVKGLVYRGKESSVARGRQMQIFFGGHAKEWASPKDQHVLLSDFTTAKLG